MNEPKVEILSNFEDGIIRPEDNNPPMLDKPTFKELENVEVEGGCLVRSSGYSATDVFFPDSALVEGYKAAEHGLKSFVLYLNNARHQCFLLIAQKEEYPIRLYMYPAIKHDGEVLQQWVELTENYDARILRTGSGAVQLSSISNFLISDYFKHWNVRLESVISEQERFVTGSSGHLETSIGEEIEATLVSDVSNGFKFNKLTNTFRTGGTVQGTPADWNTTDWGVIFEVAFQKLQNVDSINALSLSLTVSGVVYAQEEKGAVQITLYGKSSDVLFPDVAIQLGQIVRNQDHSQLNGDYTILVDGNKIRDVNTVYCQVIVRGRYEHMPFVSSVVVRVQRGQNVTLLHPDSDTHIGQIIPSIDDWRGFPDNLSVCQVLSDRTDNTSIRSTFTNPRINISTIKLSNLINLSKVSPIRVEIKCKIDVFNFTNPDHLVYLRLLEDVDGQKIRRGLYHFSLSDNLETTLTVNFDTLNIIDPSNLFLEIQTLIGQSNVYINFYSLRVFYREEFPAHLRITTQGNLSAGGEDDFCNIARNRFTRELQSEISDSSKIKLNNFSASAYGNTVRLFISYFKNDVEKVLGIVLSPILNKIIDVIYNEAPPAWRLQYMGIVYGWMTQPVTIARVNANDPSLTGVYRYKLVYLYGDGQTSLASVASDTLTVYQQKIVVPLVYDQISQPSRILVYRTKDGGNIFYLVRNVNYADNKFIIDDRQDSELNTVLTENRQTLNINKWQITNYNIKSTADMLSCQLQVFPLARVNIPAYTHTGTFNNFYRFVAIFMIDGYQYCLPIKMNSDGGEYIGSSAVLDNTGFANAVPLAIKVRCWADLAKLDLRISSFLIGCFVVNAEDYTKEINSATTLGNAREDFAKAQFLGRGKTTSEEFIVVAKSDNLTVKTTHDVSRITIDFPFAQNWSSLFFQEGSTTHIMEYEKPLLFDNYGTVAGLLNRFGTMNDIYNLDYSPQAKVIKQIGERLYFANLTDKPEWVRHNLYSGSGVSMPDIAPISEVGGLGYFIPQLNQFSPVLAITVINNNQHLVILKRDESLVYNMVGNKVQIKTLADIFSGMGTVNINSLVDTGSFGLFWQGDNGTFFYGGGKDVPIDISKHRIRQWLLNKLSAVKDTLNGCWLPQTQQYMLLYKEGNNQKAVKFKISDNKLCITTQTFAHLLKGVTVLLDGTVLIYTDTKIFKLDKSTFLYGNLPARTAIIETNEWNHRNYFSNFNGLNMFADYETKRDIRFSAIINDEAGGRMGNKKWLSSQNLYDEFGFSYGSFYNKLKLVLAMYSYNLNFKIKSFGWKYSERVIDYFKGVKRNTKVTNV